MKHCPSPTCPYTHRHRGAAEYRDEATTCSDCDARLVEGPPPPVAASVVQLESALVRRLVLTLTVPVLLYFSGYLTAPGIDRQALRSVVRSGPTPELGVFALGLIPFVTASVIVELVALLVPRWRHLGHGSLESRGRLRWSALLLTLILAGVQAYFVASYLRGSMLPLLDPDDSLANWLFIGSLVAGVFALYALARLIDRAALGGGVPVLIASGVLTSALPLVRPFSERLSRGDNHVLELGAELLLLAGLTYFALTAHERERGEAGAFPLPLPTSGAVALGAAGVVLGWLRLIPGLQLDPFLMFQAHHPIVLSLGVALPLSLGLSFLWNRPSRVAEVRAFAQGRDDSTPNDREVARGDVRRAAAWTMLWVTLVVGITLRIGTIFSASIDVALLIVAVAVALDVASELKARRGRDLVVAWPLHEVHAVMPVLAALAAKDIPAYPRSAHYRALLQFFGPYAPIDILVPAAQREQAEEVIKQLFFVEEDPDGAVAASGPPAGA